MSSTFLSRLASFVMNRLPYINELGAMKSRICTVNTILVEIRGFFLGAKKYIVPLLSFKMGLLEKIGKDNIKNISLKLFCINTI